MNVAPPAFRRLMGQWATGVSIVTSPGDAGPTGCTVNAVTSLSLDPPLLIVALDLRARTLHAVQESGRFCVNVLADGQDEVALRFASKATMPEKFEGLDWHERDGVPVLDDTVASILCTLEDDVAGGDHRVVVGRVVDGELHPEREPLLYFRGEFCQRAPSGCGR